MGGAFFGTSSIKESTKYGKSDLKIKNWNIMTLIEKGKKGGQLFIDSISVIHDGTKEKDLDEKKEKKKQKKKKKKKKKQRKKKKKQKKNTKTILERGEGGLKGKGEKIP